MMLSLTIKCTKTFSRVSCSSKIKLMNMYSYSKREVNSVFNYSMSLFLLSDLFLRVCNVCVSKNVNLS